MKSPGWLTRTYDRYCDRDKAARRWKKAYVAAGVAWTVRLAVELGGAADLYMHYNANAKPDKTIWQNITSDQQFLYKFMAYEAIWLALTTVRWGGFGYGSVGLLRVHQLKKERAALAAKPPTI